MGSQCTLVNILTAAVVKRVSWTTAEDALTHKRAHRVPAALPDSTAVQATQALIHISTGSSVSHEGEAGETRTQSPTSKNTALLTAAFIFTWVEVERAHGGGCGFAGAHFKMAVVLCESVVLIRALWCAGVPVWLKGVPAVAATEV